MANIRKVATFLATFGIFFGSQTFVYVFYACFFLVLIAASLVVISRKTIVNDQLLMAFSIFVVYSIVNATVVSTESIFAPAMVFRLIIALLFMWAFRVVLDGDSSSAAIYGLISGCVVNLALSPVEAWYISGRLLGTTANPNHLSFLACFSLVCTLFSQRISPRTIGVLVFVVVPLVWLTQSRKGILIVGALCFLFYSGLFEKKVSFKGLAPLVGFSAIFGGVIYFLFDFFMSTSLGERFMGIGLSQISNFSLADAQSYEGDSSSKWRLIFLATALELFLENPVFGIGLDGFKTIFADDLYSHSNLAELASTLGVAGLLLYYRFLVRLLRALISRVTFGRVATVLIFIFLEFTMVSYFERFYLITLVLLMNLAKQFTPGTCPHHAAGVLNRADDR